jgi:hypothetical protein
MLKWTLIVLALLGFFYWLGTAPATTTDTAYTGAVSDRPQPTVQMTERVGPIPLDRTLDPGETVVE